MKLRRRLAVLVIVLVASLAAAATAVALTRAQAQAAAISKAEWKSACGMGYWACTGAVASASGPYGGKEQWEVTVVVFREHNALKETCQWNIPLTSNGSYAYPPYGGCKQQDGGGSPVAQ